MQYCRAMALVLLIVGFLITAGCISSASNTSTPAAQPVPLTEDQIKSMAVDVKYDSLMRNPETYTGKMVHFKGGVTQVSQDGPNKANIRVYTSPSSMSSSWYTDDDVLLNWVGKERYLEDDRIEFWGTFTGLKSYTTVLGAERTIPEIDGSLIYLFEGKNEMEIPTPMPYATVPTPIPYPSPSKSPTKTVSTVEVTSVSVSGNGNDVKSFTMPNEGFYIFNIRTSDTSYSSVVLKDSKGNWVASLANEMGAYSGKKSEQLSPGKYYLEVTADGSWSIDINKA